MPDLRIHVLAACLVFLGAALLAKHMLLASSARADEPHTLQVREALAVQGGSGERADYRVALTARSCAFGSLVGANLIADLAVFAPGASEPLRRFRGEAARPLDFGFCADAPGSYRVQVAIRSGDGQYRMKLEAILPRSKARPHIAKQVVSPRLAALAASLNAAADSSTKAAREEEFWAEVQQRGAPLVEPHADGQDLVTFLYRGTRDTHEVSLDWPAWTFGFAQRSLARLGDSDVWFKSLRMPHETRMSYKLVIDPPQAGASARVDEDQRLAAVSRADPLNPKRMGAGQADPFEQRSVLELPGAAPETWLARQEVSVGRIAREQIASDKLRNTHELAIYLPVRYSERGPAYPLLILFDGETYLDAIAAPRLLDNLIAAGEITPLVVVFVRNATRDSRSRELPCNATYADFLTEELLPFVRAHYHVSSDPARVGVGGASFGGLAASFAAYRHPEAFGLVLSQSGSYWWFFSRKNSAFDGSEAPGWLVRRYGERPALPIRFYLTAGLFERATGLFGVLESNRALRDVLRARGYTLDYEEFAGGHDPLAWRATLPNGLRALFGARR